MTEGRALASESEFVAEKIITEEPEEISQEMLSLVDVPFPEAAARESESDEGAEGELQRKGPASESAPEAVEVAAPAVNAAE